MGFTEALTLVFIILKLVGVIDWSWWLVLLPEIIALTFYTLIAISVFLKGVSVVKKSNKKGWK
ncbi:hypothetical protein Q5427_10970 [Brochothrix thermosphacta]|uniref:hypothetical protein n=1 Tax=Brochothrix thermosphacta TaxID=2756 RepID=UPI002713F942|nr:hypothetical protein [Brochothrix thermosphacta]MDO7864810.1 hypothetical protein [Brochothrix thermosphacta]